MRKQTAKVSKASVHYKSLNTTSIRDSKLSLKATGLLAYLMTMADEWKGQIFEVAFNKKDGKDSIRSAFKELQELGYAELKSHPRTDDGRFHGKYWMVYDEPKKD